jgi:hypothetical protein
MGTTRYVRSLSQKKFIKQVLETHTCKAKWENEILKIMVQSQPQANSAQDSTSKITTAKRTGNVAQFIDYLQHLSVLEVQSSEFKTESHKNF